VLHTQQNNNSDIELEKAILGAAIINNDIAIEVASRLKPSHFTETKTKAIHKALKHLMNEKSEISRITINNALKQLNEVNPVPLPYLADITQHSHAINEIKGYISTLDEYRYLRGIKILANDLNNSLRYDNKTAIAEITQTITKAETFQGLAVASDWMTELNKSRNDWKDIDLDELEHWAYPDLKKFIPIPFPGGKLISVAGTTGTGKTAFMLNNAIHLASLGVNVVYFSLEMSKTAMGRRAVKYLTGHDPIHAKTENPIAKSAVEKNMDKLAALPLEIRDERDIDKLEGCLFSRVKSDTKTVIFIDYLGLLTIGGQKGSLYEKVTALTTRLKKIAMSFEIDIIVGVQFNRSVGKEKRQGQLYDLRDSGSIEQDSDEVLILDRPNMRDEDKISTGIEKAKVIIAKNREGITGEIDIGWDNQKATYVNWADY